jgi:hypothetical protein
MVVALVSDVILGVCHAVCGVPSLVVGGVWWLLVLASKLSGSM